MLSAALFFAGQQPVFFDLRLTGNLPAHSQAIELQRRNRCNLERSLAGEMEARNILVEHICALVAHIIKKILYASVETGGPHIHWHHRSD